VADFFSESSFSFDGFGVGFGSTLFLGAGFGVGVACTVGLGELFGVGDGLGLGAVVGVGVGDGSWISLFAAAAICTSSGFSGSRGVGAGVLFGSTTAAAWLFIQTTVSRFGRAASRPPRASARRSPRCATAMIATFRQKRASRGITCLFPLSSRCRLW
jgi:hypothetical protein